MRKKPFVPTEGVSNIELFYDLIFVYVIGRNNALLQIFENGFVANERFDMRDATFLVKGSVPNRQMLWVSSASEARANP